MAVELTFVGRKNEVSPEDKQAVFSELDSINQSTSSTSGTYSLGTASFAPTTGSPELYDVHIALSLKDADDADYPNVKDNLAETVASLTLDFGSKADIEEELSGTMS